MADETALDRLKAAVKGRPAHAYAKVRAADVVGLGGLIPAEKHTATTAALVAGAERAIEELPETADREALEVFQVAGQVTQLVALAEAE